MPIKSKTKFHITTGHSTIMGILYLFCTNKQVKLEKNVEALTMNE